MSDSFDRQPGPDPCIARLEAELAERDARIARLEQSWEQWLRLISHDFRGPLTLVLGYAQTLLQSLPETPDREQERHDLSAAISAAQRLDKMVGQIVDAARLEARLLVLAKAETDIAPIIRDQVKKARHRYPGRSIRASIANDLPLIETDSRRVGQIIMTLLSNAILFSPSASVVMLTAQRGPGSVVIAVDDRGIGLDEDDLARLFERFYRPDRARETRREGLGLSLVVAAQLALDLGGRIWATSPGLGLGATFYVELPC